MSHDTLLVWKYSACICGNCEMAHQDIDTVHMLVLSLSLSLFLSLSLLCPHMAEGTKTALTPCMNRLIF